MKLKDLQLNNSMLPDSLMKEKLKFNFWFSKYNDDVREKIWLMDFEANDKKQQLTYIDNSFYNGNIKPMQGINTQWNNRKVIKNLILRKNLLTCSNTKFEDQHQKALSSTMRSSIKSSVKDGPYKTLPTETFTSTSILINKTEPNKHKHKPRLSQKKKFIISLNTFSNFKKPKSHNLSNLTSSKQENVPYPNKDKNRYFSSSQLSFYQMRTASLSNSIDMHIKKLDLDSKNVETGIISEKSKQRRNKKKWIRNYSSIKWKMTSENEKDLRPDKILKGTKLVPKINTVITNLRQKKNVKDLISDYIKNNEDKKLERRIKEENRKRLQVNKMMQKILAIEKKIETKYLSNN